MTIVSREVKNLPPPLRSGGVSGCVSGVSDESHSALQAACTKQLAQLRWTRKCFGKIRVSIAPQPLLRRQEPDNLTQLYRLRNGRYETRQAKWERELENRAAGRRGALDSSGEFQETNRARAGWGKLAKRHIFTKYAADTIQEVLWIAKQKYDSQGIFLTGTVPAVSGIARFIVAEWSSWLVNRVKQRVRDTFSADFTVVSVWEHTKKGAPHLHLALLSNEHEMLLKTLACWQEWWFGILTDLTKQTGVNLFERFISVKNDKSLMSWCPCGPTVQADAQVVDKDIARYLSKYVSKSARKESSTSFYHPSRWWSVDNASRREAKAERLRLSVGGLSVEAIKAAFSCATAKIQALVEKIFSFEHPLCEGWGGIVSFLEDGADFAPLADFIRYLNQNNFEYSLESNV